MNMPLLRITDIRDNDKVLLERPIESQIEIPAKDDALQGLTTRTVVVVRIIRRYGKGGVLAEVAVVVQ